MTSLSRADLARAERFVWLNARVLDRHRFALHFRGGPPGPLLAALRPYATPDGGYGHALEPDLRGPAAQPAAAQHALDVLHEAGADDDPAVTRVADFLTTITRPDGGVPFVLPTAPDDPHAPWWTTGDDPPSALNPTATLAGMLHRAGSTHPWLAPATDYCWTHLERDRRHAPYDVLAALTFLDHVPDRDRATAALDRNADAFRAPDGPGDHHRPLDLAPTPDGLGRRLFDDATIDADLDALAAEQHDDGGWTFPWPAWTPAVRPEWRGLLTIERLRTLRAYGRLQE
ncbi:hypothetical protein GCM10009678_88200 [Actinomadura kijaniata]|uniref:Uncharacterized protein n=1 Tax=Actinomadura namibiensis TaxID=182080 RepID=A0A7W3LT87_ACTNM|nr:hypothetical protein [Actinomadura namibiensis]MBA8953827.1 hypothetical protein [Actinomadura namibiensis]